MSTELVAAEDVGIDPKRLDLFLARVRLEVEHGPLPSAQVAVARQGRLVAFETYGDATNGHRYILQSVGRNVVAAATWKLLGDGALALGERVADVIPEFGTNGKDVVTVEQVLTHSGGFPFAPLGYPKMLDRGSRLEAFATVAPRLGAGQQAPVPSHLGRLGHRRAGRAADGQGLRRVPADGDRRASRSGVRPAAARRSLPRGPGGARPPPTGRATTRKWTRGARGTWPIPRSWPPESPATPSSGSAADLVLLGQALFHSGLWDEATVADAIRIRRSEAPFGDQIYGGSPETANIGLFCMVSGEYGGNGFTPRTGSARTFGHRGAPAQLAFTDADSRHLVRLPHQRLPAGRVRLLGARRQPGSSTSGTWATISLPERLRTRRRRA